MDATETAKNAGLTDGYGNWRNEMDDYIYKKTNFQGVPEPYKKVTNAFVKSQEVLYNPITQTFTNKEKEDQVRQMERQNMTDVLAQNKVSFKILTHLSDRNPLLAYRTEL